MEIDLRKDMEIDLKKDMEIDLKTWKLMERHGN